MKNLIDLLASLDADFVNCFYCVNITRQICLQGRFDKYSTMLNFYTFAVQLKRTDDTGTQYFEGVLTINGVQIEIVLTND